MNIPDLINGSFELCGGLLCWFNVKKLLAEKEIKGVYWPIQGFFTTWGAWNLFYYSNLNQWASFCGGVLLLIGNGTWVVLARHYENKNQGEMN